MADGGVTVRLTSDEALVLFEWLHRTDRTTDFADIVEDQAEQRVLWNLICVLEREIPELHEPNYHQLLAAARDRLRDE